MNTDTTVKIVDYKYKCSRCNAILDIGYNEMCEFIENKIKKRYLKNKSILITKKFLEKYNYKECCINFLILSHPKYKNNQLCSINNLGYTCSNYQWVGFGMCYPCRKFLVTELIEYIELEYDYFVSKTNYITSCWNKNKKNLSKYIFQKYFMQINTNKYEIIFYLRLLKFDKNICNNILSNLILDTNFKFDNKKNIVFPTKFITDHYLLFEHYFYLALANFNYSADSFKILRYFKQNKCFSCKNTVKFHIEYCATCEFKQYHYLNPYLYFQKYFYF